MSSLHFDPFQFAGRRSLPVYAEFTQDGWTSNGISYEDLGRMQSQNSSVPLRDPRWTPAFAASDEQLRRVLLHKAWSYIHHNQSAPPDDWKGINAAATKKVLAVHFKNCPTYKKCESEAHVGTVKRAGGYLQLLAAISFRAWRLRQDSVGIAEALHMSPQGVRVILQRLCNVARRLGYETFSRHHSFGRPRPVKRDSRKYDDVRFNHARIIALYEVGKRVSEIAQAIGYPKGHGNNRVRDVLIGAGIYKGCSHATGQ